MGALNRAPFRRPLTSVLGAFRAGASADYRRQDGHATGSRLSPWPTQSHVRRYAGLDRKRRWREQLGFRHLSAKGKLRVKLLPNFDASEWNAAVLTNRSPILLATK
jgi:hypothetical protein